MTDSILAARNLSMTFPNGNGGLRALNQVRFEVRLLRGRQPAQHEQLEFFACLGAVHHSTLASAWRPHGPIRSSWGAGDIFRLPNQATASAAAGSRAPERAGLRRGASET